jgi:hypothetical protein
MLLLPFTAMTKDKLVLTWFWDALQTKFFDEFSPETKIYFKDWTLFFGLRFGLNRCQSKILAELFFENGYPVAKNGVAYIVKFESPMVLEVLT